MLKPNRSHQRSKISANSHIHARTALGGAEARSGLGLGCAAGCSCGASFGIQPLVPRYPRLFQDLCNQINADIFSAVRIGNDHGIIAPGHDVVLRAGVRAVESQFPQLADQLSPRDWSELTRQRSQAPQKP